MAAPPPDLMDELVEEILLRIPPDDPACLARAAVVCKRWCRLVTDRGFRRRFRQFHGRPPMLGFVINLDSRRTDFLPTSSFRPRSAVADWWSYPLLDARHGHVLLYYRHDDDDPLYYDDPVARNSKDLIVWTPATGEVSSLHNLCLSQDTIAMAAALLCGAKGCDHKECEWPWFAPFSVIMVVGENLSRLISYVYVYSTEDGIWTQTATIPGFVVESYTRAAFASNALYFLLEDNKGILEYNLSKKQLSVIRLPPICYESTGGVVLMTVEEGDGLGFAMVTDFSLCIWLRESAPTPSGGWTWTQHRVVDIKSFLSVSPLPSSLYIIAAAADAVGVFVIWANEAGVLAIDLRSSQVTKVSDDGDDFVTVIPCMSFCTPSALLRATSINEEPSTGVSTNA